MAGIGMHLQYTFLIRYCDIVLENYCLVLHGKEIGFFPKEKRHSKWKMIAGKLHYWTDTRSQFYQHFTSRFFKQKCFVQIFSTYSLSLYFLPKNIGAKAACKMFVKLTKGVNFDKKIITYGATNRTWLLIGVCYRV